MTTEKCIDCGIDLGMTAYRVPRCARCEVRKEFADKVKWISDKISGLAYRNRGYFLFCPITNRAKKELELTKETGIDIWKTPERLFDVSCVWMFANILFNSCLVRHFNK